MINGEMTHKGSPAHEAAITGDTVGDPFKDTSGPSMNILIKLTCLIGLVIAPILGGHTDEVNHANTTTVEVTETVADNTTTEVKVLMKNENGKKNATVITTTEVDGKKEVIVETLEGDDVDLLVVNRQ